MENNPSTILKKIKDEDIVFVDLRFTDTLGKLQHLTIHADKFSEDDFADGVMFDGSSITGWKDINESDMALMPDPNTTYQDPFFAQKTLVILCDILEPGTGEAYERDPRMTAKKAEAYLVKSKIGDKASFGAEPEFFLFDDVRFINEPNETGFSIDSTELPTNTATEYQNGNKGHRPKAKGGYFPVPPIDSAQDIRSEMLAVMKEIGLSVDKHHHEVAPAQHELGIEFNTLTKSADNLQAFKYVIQQVAASYGKSATFMPKPIFGDNGSGMHCHQSIWKNDKPLFAGNQYADLSEECLFYIGGIIKHAKALNAITNPGTNSYRRLVPGYEAPVLLAYSSRNRSASCRIPYAVSPNGKRIEVRFPDPLANPYLAFAAMLMAGLDGIENKIHPGEPLDKNLYDLPPEELKDVPTIAASLEEALNELEKDCDFLKKDNVFSQDQIQAYIELKRNDVERIKLAPHPAEFDIYYSY